MGKRGRPPKGEEKRVVVKVYLTRAEIEMLDRARETTAEERSVFIRRAIVEAAEDPLYYAAD